MKRSLLALASLSLGAVQVLAADLPSRRAPPVYAPPPPIPIFSWTGFYIGAQAGYAFGRATNTYAVTNNGPAFLMGSSNPDGVIGGGHAGYLFSTQSIPVISNITGVFASLPLIGGLGGAGGVFGIEGDVDGSNYGRTFAPAPGISASVRNDIQGSVRGRLGFAVDRALIYATGGAAFADFKDTTNFGGFGTDSVRHSRVGWTVGGGVEYSVSPQVSFRIEYRYSDFARYSENLANSTLTAYDARHHEIIQRVQGGISYRFATPVVPVVARY